MLFWYDCLILSRRLFSRLLPTLSRYYFGTIILSYLDNFLTVNFQHRQLYNALRLPNFFSAYPVENHHANSSSHPSRVSLRGARVSANVSALSVGPRVADCGRQHHPGGVCAPTDVPAEENGAVSIYRTEI